MLDWKLNIGCIMTYQFFKYPQIYKNYQTYYPCFQKLLSFKNALNLIFYIFSMDLLNITWFIDLRKIDVELQKSTKIKIWKIKNEWFAYERLNYNIAAFIDLFIGRFFIVCIKYFVLHTLLSHFYQTWRTIQFKLNNHANFISIYNWNGRVFTLCMMSMASCTLGKS